MSSLGFLVAKKIKNSFLEIIRKPSQLILVLFLAFMMIFTIFAGNTGEVTSFRSVDELYGIVFVLYTVAFILTAKNGFNNGASMFSMADVNLLFTSPFKNTSVLFYGLLSGIQKSLTLGLFILFQATTVKTTYNIGFGGLLVIFAGYALTVFLSQMTAMIIYSYTSSSDKKVNVTKYISVAVLLCFFLFFLYLCKAKGGINIENAVEASKSKTLYFFPISGITLLFVKSIISKSLLPSLLALVFIAVLVVFFVIISSLSGKEYYEDVLKSTEISFSAITARKEGKIEENVARNVKVGKTGFEKGFGADTFYYKHKIENRRSKTRIVNIVSVVYTAISFVFCVVIGDPLPVFYLNLYLLMVLVGQGRWAKELTKPFAFLVPESPVKKLWYIIKEQLPTLFLQSALLVLPIWLVIKVNPLIVLFMAVAVFSFSMIFIGTNLFIQRFFESSDKKVLALLMYFILAFLFSVPGVAIPMVLSAFYTWNFMMIYTVMTVINLAVFSVIFFTSRNVLKYSDFR